jgi:transposase-like protein
VLQQALDRPHKRTRRRRQVTQEALALRAQGASLHEIAGAMGVATSTITQWFLAHRREIADGTIDRMLDDTAVPLAAENLIHGLIAGDKDYTLETLKGRGVLKRHSEGDGQVTQALPALRIIFETPPADTLRAAHPTVGGSVVGTVAVPKALPAAAVPTAAVPPDVEAEIVGKVE